MTQIHRRLLLFVTLMVAATVFSGCTQSLTDPAMSSSAGYDLAADDQDNQLVPTGKGTPPDVVGTWSFIGTGTTSAGEAFTLTLGGRAATRISDNLINLGSNKDGTYVVAESGSNEVYNNSKGGGKITMGDGGVIKFNINFTDPNGNAGILKFKGNLSVNLDDGLAVGTFAITNIEASYNQGDTRDVLNYDNAAVTLDASARVGTFTLTATGTAQENGQTINVNVQLSGVARGFINAPTIKWNAQQGSWTDGDEVYILQSGPGAVNVATGKIRYNGNFVKQGTDEAGIGKFKGTVSGITLNKGKVTGTFPVTLDKAVYVENDGTEVPATITSASITFDIK